MEESDVICVVKKASQLSANELKELEIKVQIDPNNLSYRLLLIGYYFKHYYCCESAHKDRVKHIVWLIENHPDYHFYLGPFLDIPLNDPDTYKVVNLYWKKVLSKYSKNSRVIGNKAFFSQSHEPRAALRFCESALKLDPNNRDLEEFTTDLKRNLKECVKLRQAVQRSHQPVFIPGAVLCANSKTD